jgi:hypothetical protein
MVFTVIVGAFTVAFGAHCYLVVVQDTAAGLDRVKWPQETLLDWLLRGLRLGGLALVWLVPAGFLSRALEDAWLSGNGGLRFLLLAVPGLWLFFPLMMLATMSGQGARKPEVLGGLMRNLPAVLAFYLITAVLLAGVGALWYAALFTVGWYALIAAAPAGAAVLFIHARLFGRIAWLIGRSGAAARPRPVPGRRASGERERPVRKPQQGAPAPGSLRAVAVEDPWAAPPEDKPRPARPARADEAGYGLAAAEPPPVPGPKPPAPRRPYVEEPARPYALADEPPPAPAVEEGREPPVSESALERELQMRDRSSPDPPPAYPLFSGVYSFPWYDTSGGPWLWLASGLLATGMGLRGLVIFWPF